MAVVEPWMEHGLCAMFPAELCWIKDPDQVAADELEDMRITCSICAVAALCRDYVGREHITSGFWAGEFRDPPADAVDGAA